MKKSMQKGFTLIELMIVVAIIAILAAIAIPQYQTYVVRSQVTRVIGEANSLKPVVEDCLNNGQTTMAADRSNPSAGECATTATSSDLIASSSAQGGVTSVPVIDMSDIDAVTITAPFGENANAALAAASGEVELSRDDEGNWTCSTNSVDAKYVPQSCQ